jgi:hypothetical protein
MSETLLSLSEVLLFGREVEDLQIRKKLEIADTTHQATVATAKKLTATSGHPNIDKKAIIAGNIVLVFHQHGDVGLYTVNAAGAAWTQITVEIGETISVEKGTKHKDSIWIKKDDVGQKFRPYGKRKGLGRNKQLGNQLDEDARFARIYGFSYEGTYYELPNPTLFLVHGDGESATDGNQPGTDHASRAPIVPSVSGVAAADFQFADDIMVWAYDKADYTIRMDVETGMFEQVLLEIFFSGGDAMISGAKVSGAKVSGAKVSGAKVSGAKVSGAKVSGAKARGPGD